MITFASIDLPTARLVEEAAGRHATALGVPMSFAVLDFAGHPILMSRMTGAGFLTVDIARAKAFAALAFAADSGVVQERLAGAPYLVAALAAHGGFVAHRGAVVIRHEGVIVGALGASGGTAVQDEEIAAAAVAEVMAGG